LVLESVIHGVRLWSKLFKESRSFRMDLQKIARAVLPGRALAPRYRGVTLIPRVVPEGVGSAR